VNGIHDMGGMDGFGRVIPEPNEPVFHADWERRMFGIAAAIPFTMPYADDHLRREIERIAPADYLTSGYYELWYRAISSLLQERGVFGDAPIRAGTPVPAAGVADAISAGATTRMAEDGITPRFAIGDPVMTRNLHPDGHTRLPRYARGKYGRIDRIHGVFSFADTNARGLGPCPQHLYAVTFTARELWGPDAALQNTVVLDLWDSYLDPAS
jgi:nitrile hydratase